MLNPSTIRQDFPIYASQPELVYLDSAATALKPKMVIEAMSHYYSEYSTNVGRGLYPLAEKATLAFDKARKTVARFVNTKQPDAVVFAANATQAINLVALGLEHRITAENNIVVTELEHHSNYLPWKELARRTGAELRIAHFTSDGFIDATHLVSLVDSHTAIVAFSAVSNVFGVVNSIPSLIASLRRVRPETLVLVDACQLAGHFPIDSQAWDADFIVFSGHKLFGPTGIGVLTGKIAALELLTPMNVGGGTVLDACSSVTEYKRLPENLEGGTPNIAGAIGLGAAIDFVEGLGWEHIRAHERTLVHSLITKLRAAFGDTLHILGSEAAESRAGIVAFTLDGIHPHDLAQLLGEEDVCVRAGEHCAAPLHRAIGLSASTRVSVSVYSTESDIDRLVSALKKAWPLFKK